MAPITLPLQFGIPGGPELLVILMMMIVFMGLPVLFVVLAVVGGVKLLGGSNDERIEELEQRVARLEGQLESTPGATGGDVEAGEKTAEDRPGDGSRTASDRY